MTEQKGLCGSFFYCDATFLPSDRFLWYKRTCAGSPAHRNRKRSAMKTVKKSIICKLTCVVLSLALLMGLCACGAAAPSESAKPSETAGQETQAPESSSEEKETGAQGGSHSHYTPGSAQGKETDDTFRSAYLALASKLFQTHYAGREGSDSTLISPLSILIALAMTANGAENETLAEMEALLGGEDIDLEALNQYVYTYINELPSGEKARFAIADAIWFKEMNGFTVNEDFLQKDVDYFKAGIYQAPFDQTTVKDINDWVEKNTDGMIKEILQELSEDARMILINALCFDAKWAAPFDEYQLDPHGKFTGLDGKKQPVTMMYDSVWSYLHDEDTTGFIKLYEGGTYGFVALLPEEGTDFDAYIASLTPEKLQGLIGSENAEKTTIGLPKFSYDCEWAMVGALKELGMKKAFEPFVADFRGISEDESLFISQVLHKTHIEVTEAGTRAAAVTAVIVEAAEALEEKPKEVILDRPFVYMIVDMQNKLPIFIGAVTEISG